jgi:hypothetical protein
VLILFGVLSVFTTVYSAATSSEAEGFSTELFFSPAESMSSLIDSDVKRAVRAKADAILEARAGAARIVMTKPGEIIDSETFIFSSPDGSTVKLRKDELTPLYTPGLYKWSGFVQDERFSESGFEEEAKTYPRSSVEAVKRSLIGSTLYFEQWSRHRVSGEVKRSDYIGDRAFAVAPENMILVQRGDPNYETFYSVKGSIPVVGTDEELTIEHLDKEAPNFAIITRRPIEKGLPEDGGDVITVDELETTEEGRRLLTTIEKHEALYSKDQKELDKENQ